MLYGQFWSTAHKSRPKKQINDGDYYSNALKLTVSI